MTSMRLQASHRRLPTVTWQVLPSPNASRCLRVSAALLLGLALAVHTNRARAQVDVSAQADATTQDNAGTQENADSQENAYEADPAQEVASEPSGVPETA